MGACCEFLRKPGLHGFHGRRHRCWVQTFERVLGVGDADLLKDIPTLYGLLALCPVHVACPGRLGKVCVHSENQ